jgi:hypothetical protein
MTSIPVNNGRPLSTMDRIRLQPITQTISEGINAGTKFIDQHVGQSIALQPGQPINSGQVLRFTIPPGTAPGSLLKIQGPKGQMIDFKVPNDKKPGDVVDIIS